jgi:hypothetical protein
MRFEGKLHFRIANIGHPSENTSGKPCKDFTQISLLKCLFLKFIHGLILSTNNHVQPKNNDGEK